MENAFNVFKQIGNFTYDKTVKAKDFVVEKVKDENFRNSISNGVENGINNVKQFTSKTIGYVADPLLKDNLKKDISKGYDVTKDKLNEGFETIKKPEFHEKVKNNIKNTYEKTSEGINKTVNYVNNYVIIDFDNLKPDQITYLINLSDEEIQRRFNNEEIEKIYEFKRIYEESEKAKIEKIEVNLNPDN